MSLITAPGFTNITIHPNHKHNKNNSTNQHNSTTTSTIKKTYILVPYTKGLSESYKNVCRKPGIQVLLDKGKPSEFGVRCLTDSSVKVWNAIKNILRFKVRREVQNLIRTIKESIYKRVNNPSLNKNDGKYHLPHIWDEVLSNTQELKIIHPYSSGYSIGNTWHTISQISQHIILLAWLSGLNICHTLAQHLPYTSNLAQHLPT